jgi:hypothetical protein
MGQCKDCERYNGETNWCARLNRKKTPESGCREFIAEPTSRKPPRGVPIATLDSLVDWMSRRAVVAIKHGELAITLGTLDEPPPQIEKPATNPEPETEDERRERIRNANKAIWYGASRTNGGN